LTGKSHGVWQNNKSRCHPTIRETIVDERQDAD